MKTQAAILQQLKKPLVVDEVKVPEPGFGQVLVRLHYSGLCGSQLGEIDGVKGKDPYLPHLLGHEGSGVVEGVGPGVTQVKAGDSVVLHWRKGRGLEAQTPAYSWKGKRLNAGWVTTFNERAVVSENRVTKIPQGFDMAAAALLGCALTTGAGIINNNAKVKLGESVVVFGAGGVGLSEIQAASMAGAYPIIAIDIHDHKLKAAERFGADYAFNSKKMDAKKAVLETVGMAGADAVIDNTGNVSVIELAYSLTRPQGRTILVGVPASTERISIPSLPLHFGRVLTGSHGGEADPAEDIPRYVRLIQAGRWKLDGMISERFPLAKINEAVERLRSGAAAGRILIELSQRQGGGRG